jgi:hypothetical protein
MESPVKLALTNAVRDRRVETLAAGAEPAGAPLAGSS